VASLIVGGVTNFTAAGQTGQVTATAFLSDGTRQDVTTQASWQSSNPAVITISATGLMTSVTSGVVTITATYQGKSNGMNVAVNIASLPNVAGTWTGTLFLCCGFTLNDETMTWQLTQNGTSFSGTVTISGDILMGQTTGTVTGTIPSADIAYTVTIAPNGMAGQPGCSLVFSGLFGVFNGPKLVGEKITGGTFCGNISSRSSPVDPVSGFSLLKK
jgi:hypothetical protein